MINQEKQLEDLLIQVKKLSTPTIKVTRIINFLETKIASTRHQDSLIIQKILVYSQTEGDTSILTLSSKEIAQVITKSVKSIKSISIMIILYSSWERCRRTSMTDVDWKGEYERRRGQGFLESFNAWVQTNSINHHAICNQVLSRVLAGIPNLIQIQKIKSTYQQFDSCILWLSLFTIKTNEDHLCAAKAARLVKEVTDIRLNDYEKKEHLILRKIIELLGETERKNNSLYLFFDKFTIRSEDIEYFINIREDFFEDLDEKHLCNVFHALVYPGINKEILEFFSKVSGLLKSNDQYFSLRTLFEQIVLPIVAKDSKIHKKLGEEIFQFVLYYMAGFLSHCFIGEEGLKCILNNIQLVDSLTLRRKWGELAILCCKEDNELRPKTQKELQKMGLHNLSTKKQMIWTVTMHNGRKLKKYPEIQSHRFKGIQNLNNQCYIISVVQALYTTEELRNLVIQLKAEAKKQGLKIIEQLRFIFEKDLNAEEKNSNATVKYLKNVGPEQFRSTIRQQDSQQYLGKLFECLETELMKTKGGFESFNQIFRTEYVVKISCKQCKLERQLKEHEFHYVNTYGTKEIFQIKKEEPLDQNYKCEKCSSKKCVKKTTMINRPKILILHINRFKHNQGETKKILGNQPIKRTIQDYKLVGFVAHKGSHIHAGHYLYYSRVDQSRWALFNDNRVTEFNVAENEEFQRQFRSENTPYILFYRHKKYVK